MKQEFSNSWIGSKQTRKQRKYRVNAPLHIKMSLMGASLSKELRKKHSTRSVSVRKGDEVKIMRGEFKGKTGKITNVNLKRQRVTIEGMQNKKKDGTKINAYFNTSNLQIQNLVEDKRRFEKANKGSKEVKVKTEKKSKETKENK